MLINETHNGYELSFDFNRRLVESIKQLPKESRRYNPVTKMWWVSKQNQHFVDRLINRYGLVEKDSKPEIFGELPAMPEPSDKLTAFLQENMKLQPFHYQMQGIMKGIQFRKFINGDEPGLGKTMQSIATVLALNAFPCLVICPSSIKENWRREWSEKFTDKKAIVMSDNIKQTWPTYLRSGMVDVMIINYESLKKYFVASIDVPKGKKLRMEYIKFRDEHNLFKSIIIDEVHKLKDGTTQQTKFTLGISKNKAVSIGLTGTPIVNKPKDLVSQLAIIERFGVFGSYKHFLNRYCEGGCGASNLRELHYILHSNCFFRRNKKDVLTDLPDRIRQVSICDISTREEYTKAKNEFVTYLKDVKGCTDKEVSKKLRGQFMVQLGILKAISAKGKLSAVFDWCDSIIESGEKVVLFCNLRDIGDAVMKHYGSICVAIRGDVVGDARQRAVDDFQTNPNIKLVVCSIKAAGVGLTLTKSCYVGFIEFPWTDADCDQCESRCHRIGQKDTVFCNYFLGDKTIDSYCYELIKTKRSIAQMVAGQPEIQEEVIDNLINLFNA